MEQSLYLERKLLNRDKVFSERELLEASSHIVILAEPGAGKTELLKSLAKKLKGKEITANVFNYRGIDQVEIPLIIDAFDELAKIDETGIHKLLANISKAKPTNVIISSRSSEWNNSATSVFEQFLGVSPLVVRFCEFDDSEQQKIYIHHTKKDNFVSFQTEIARFALEPLLPNPQFLKMFADAYIESNEHFTNRSSIFTQAVSHLARENNENNKPNSTLSSNRKIELSSEIFAKLLLSGSEGIGVSEVSENRMYPLVGSLLSTNNASINGILATRLFKPGDNADQHRPVHKIVAEYCAANYLIKRISNPQDPLTLGQCLSIIAPNSIVRDELRGLLGWLAALGNKTIEETAIKLEPYSVLANGDPSQLELSSKRLLLTRLKEVEASDPDFRRGDFRRRFSVAGFFTQETIEEIKTIIIGKSDGALKGLLLELIVDSKAAKWLAKELRWLVLSPSEPKNFRTLANRSLLTIDDYDFRLDFKGLITEASHTSLYIVADAIKILGPGKFSLDNLEVFFRNCANLYPTHKDLSEVEIGSRYFIKSLISRLNLEAIEWLLDSLSKSLVCTCGKETYRCDCRTGVSKIIGSMLDRYFELAKPPFESLRIWQWINNLNFPRATNTEATTSVKLLQQDKFLRQGIITHVFGSLTNKEQIAQTLRKFNGYFSHAGLNLTYEDNTFIVDLAFKGNNPDLWVSFIPRHDYHRTKKQLGPDYLRRHMRNQASQKPEFMRKWALQNRYAVIWDKEDDREWNFRHRRAMRREDKKNRQRHEANIKYVQENRSLVESGQHWGCLTRFARLVLDKPERIEREFGDETIVRRALRNSLGFIESKVPNLQKLAELQCASKGLTVETILFAACLEIMRHCGNLECVKPSLLIALRTNLSRGGYAVNLTEQDALKKEVDRLIFPDSESAEFFLRQYVEPQLAQSTCVYPEVYFLRNDEVFHPLRAKLSIEWLARFNVIEPNSLDSLFEIAINYGKREELCEIIIVRCSEFLSKWPNATDDENLEQRRKFWFVRAFYFLNLDEAKPYLDWLSFDKNAVFLFDERSSRMNRSEHSNWPSLTSYKIEAILLAFFDKWPKVRLPSSYGTESPVEERAYRFLMEIIKFIGNDSSDEALSVLNRLLGQQRFTDIHRELKSIQAEQLRKKAMRDFEPPTPQKIVDLLDNNIVVTVDGLRQLVIQELMNYQQDIDGGEFNTVNHFYTKDKSGNVMRLDEVNSVERIAERLKLVLHPQSIAVTPEHQTKNQNRIDITATKMIDGKRLLLAIEAKGQWHSELYSAASTQLFERYSVHPDAQHQGIYLVIWFGADEKVAGKKIHEISSAQELKKSIEDKLPVEMKGLIDVFVLDVSKPK